MNDNLTIFGTDYTNVTGIKAKGTGNGTLTYIRPDGTKSITENGTGIDVTSYASVDVAVPTGGFDGPTFTAEVDQSTDGLTNITCDMSFAEVGAYTDENNAMALVNFPWDGSTVTCGASLTAASSTELKFAVNAGPGGIPIGDIILRSNDTCTWSSPSEAMTTLTATQNGTYSDEFGRAYTEVTVNVPSSLQSKFVTPTESAQVIVPDSGYDGLDEVDVAAIPSTYVGSGVTQRDSSDLTASGATVTVPAGHYAQQASKAIETGSVAAPTITVDSETGEISASARINAAGYLALNTTRSSTAQLDTQEDLTITPTTSPQIAVTAGKYTTGTVVVAAMPSGTAGTPTATKGTVSNNSVSVTPSVTNTAGYIAGGALTGTAVSISASELVNGTYAVNSSGTKDVTNYASASVPSGGATASATKGTVSNHSVTVTPRVTCTAGWVSAGTSNGTAVTVSASELVDGTLTINSSGTKDVTNYASASVAEGNATAPSSINGTAATITTGTNTLTLTKTVSVTPSVTAGYISTGTEGNSSVRLTASVPTKAATTITPSTTNQTIAAGTYLTGAQTIAGDADLVASNIVSGVQIFGVTGNVVLQNYYTGSSAPSSSLGQNGDIYIQQ